MGDSSEMTIEFLRARLLSERSVSRSSRQRADQLAKRVVELEDQLRIVTIQRKKAEKAAAEVLAILDTQGIGEFSEVIDSSSDHDEVVAGPKEENSNVKEDGSSTASRVNRSEVDDGYSTSEIEVSPSQGQGKNLSWKNDRNGSNSLEKRRTYQTRHRSKSSSFMYNSESSPKTYLGKSCRKIKRRDKGRVSGIGDGGASETGNEKNISHDPHGKQGTLFVNDNTDDCLDSNPSTTDGASASKIDNIGPMFSCPINEQIEYPNANVNAHGIDKDEDMERALEKQAELIDQYQAEENAQREWEEQFNKNNCNTGEPSGMLADTSEKRTKLEESTRLSDSGLCHDEEGKLVDYPSVPELQNGIASAEQKYDSVSKPCSSGNRGKAFAICNEPVAPDVGNSCSTSMLHVNIDGWTDQVANGTVHDYIVNPRKDQGSLSENSDIIPNSGSNHLPHADGFLVNSSLEIQSSGLSGHKFYKPQVPESQKQFIEPPHHALGHGLEGVLGALQRAKLSLRQELCRISEPTHFLQLETIDSRVMSMEQGNATGIPIGCAGLFRLPTDALPNSDIPKSGHYKFGLKLSRLSTLDRNLTVASNSSYYHGTSYSEHESIFPVRKWEADSHLINSGTGLFPPIGSRTSHFRADSAASGSFSSNGFQKPYLESPSGIFSRINQYSSNRGADDSAASGSFSSNGFQKPYLDSPSEIFSRINQYGSQ